jgi:integrase
VLSVLLGDAVDDGIIATNPALQMGRRRRKRADSLSQAERLRRVRPMSSEQLAAFLKAALRTEHHRLYPLFLTLARAGLRPGEAFGLQWDDVDFVERTLHVERSYSRGSLDTTKTGESRRVDMSQELARVLRRLEVGRAAETLRRGWKARPPWVFCSEVGTPRDLYNVTRVFKRTLKAASLPNFRLYDLRHTFATLLLAQSAPITYVAAQLGHSKPTTTLQWYAHWLPSGRRGFVDALDDPSVVPEGTVVGFEAPVVTIENPVVKLPPRRGGTPRGTNLAPFSESSNGERQVGVSVGSPSRSRTCDILIINSPAPGRIADTRRALSAHIAQ